MRRFSDELRLLADRAHARGSKELSDELHAKARELEKNRKEENERTKS